MEQYLTAPLSQPRLNMTLLHRLRRRRHCPDRNRHLRRDGLLRCATYPGNRHSHGARRAKDVTFLRLIIFF